MPRAVTVWRNLRPRFPVGDILRALEGELGAVDCQGLKPEGGCESSDFCVTKLVWQRINDSIAKAVDEITLEELMAEAKSQERKREMEQSGQYINSQDKADTKEKVLRRSRKRHQEVNMKKLIYLDNAATTKTSEEVVAAMLPYLQNTTETRPVFTSLQASKKQFQMQEERSPETLGAQEMRFISQPVVPRPDNWALKATAEAYQEQRKTHHHDQDRASCDPAYRRISGKTWF